MYKGNTKAVFKHAIIYRKLPVIYGNCNIVNLTVNFRTLPVCSACKQRTEYGFSLIDRHCRYLGKAE